MRTLALFSLAAALTASCSKDEPLPRETDGVTRSATLGLELRDTAELTFVMRGERLGVELTLSNGFGVAPGATKLALEGQIENFPEAELTLYVARGTLPPDAAGVCGDHPVSLALALEQRSGEPYIAGSLTAYCGDGVWHGIPARTPLRLSGSWPELHTVTSD